MNAYTTAGIDLAANTTYFLLLDSSVGGQLDVRNTDSDNEDSGGQSGWSIADGSVYRNRDNTGDWIDFGDSKKIAIKGYAKDDTTLSTDATLSALALEDFDGDPITLDRELRTRLCGGLHRNGGELRHCRPTVTATTRSAFGRDGRVQGRRRQSRSRTPTRI